MNNFFWSHTKKQAEGKGLGALYSMYTVLDVRNLAPPGWRIPNYDDASTMIGLVGYPDGGGKLKEIGTNNWTSPNTGATNEYGFNGLGAGTCDSVGFGALGVTLRLLLHEPGYDYDANGYNFILLSDTEYDNITIANTENEDWGFSCRMIKEDSVDPGSMMDNDGNVYPTCTIGSQVWMARNLRSKKYRNGDSIPFITDNATWATVNYGALRVFNNDESNF